MIRFIGSYTRSMSLSYKVEIQPTPTQEIALRQHAGNARWAYNWGLNQYKEAYKKWISLGKPKEWDGWPNAFSLHKDLNILKKMDPEDGGVPWMYSASKCAPQESLRNLDQAFKNFFRGDGKYPRFKSRNRGVGSFRLTGTIRTSEKNIQLPCLGRLRIKPGDHGYIPSQKYSQATVSEQAGRWFVSITGPETLESPPNKGPTVGIDLGITKLATLSDGTVIENPRHLNKGQRKLRKTQKEVSRKQKGSMNRCKARRRLARAHLRIRNLRKDALHKTTTMIAKSHSKVVIEDLQVQNMTRSGGSRKRKLNRSLHDASFGEFRRILEYKGKLYGCEVLTVNPAYTSQMCSQCGHVSRENRKSQAVFECLACGHKANADLNAAINILVAGSCPETINARGEDVRPAHMTRQTSVKQESAWS